MENPDDWLKEQERVKELKELKEVKKTNREMLCNLDFGRGFLLIAMGAIQDEIENNNKSGASYLIGQVLQMILVNENKFIEE